MNGVFGSKERSVMKKADKVNKTLKKIHLYEAKKCTRVIEVGRDSLMEQSYIDIIQRRKKAFDRLAD